VQVGCWLSAAFAQTKMMKFKYNSHFVTNALCLSSVAVQGNCGTSSQLWLLRDLEKSTAGRVEYPPLQSYQCVLLIDKPFLLNLNATLWLDSLYFAVTRTKVQSEFAILQYGHLSSPTIAKEHFDDRPTEAQGETTLVAGVVPMYITSTTFVGEGRGSTWALATFVSSASFLIEGAKLFVRAGMRTFICFVATALGFNVCSLSN
jgi:hypothetical protein